MSDLPSGFGAHDPPTPLPIWFFRGLFYAAFGVAVAIWMWPEPHDPRAKAFLAFVGVAFAVAGTSLALWALITGVVRTLRRPQPPAS